DVADDTLGLGGANLQVDLVGVFIHLRIIVVFYSDSSGSRSVDYVDVRQPVSRITSGSTNAIIKIKSAIHRPCVFTIAMGNGSTGAGLHIDLHIAGVQGIAPGIG